MNIKFVTKETFDYLLIVLWTPIYDLIINKYTLILPNEHEYLYTYKLNMEWCPGLKERKQISELH